MSTVITLPPGFTNSSSEAKYRLSPPACVPVSMITSGFTSGHQLLVDQQVFRILQQRHAEPRIPGAARQLIMRFPLGSRAHEIIQHTQRNQGDGPARNQGDENNQRHQGAPP